MKQSYPYESRDRSSLRNEEVKPIMESVVVSIGRNLRVNVREEPSLDSSVIATVNGGVTVEKESHSDQNGFSRVRLTNGVYGYMASKYLKDF